MSGYQDHKICPRCGRNDLDPLEACTCTDPKPSAAPSSAATPRDLPSRLELLAQKWGDAPHETNLANTLREAAAELRAGAVGDERAAFETWVSGEGGGITAERFESGGYRLFMVQLAWSAWQAARLTSARRISIQEAERESIETPKDGKPLVFHHPDFDNALQDAVAWDILHALHAMVPEEGAPTGWADCSDAQIARVKRAATAAILRIKGDK